MKIKKALITGITDKRWFISCRISSEEKLYGSWN